MIAATRGGRTLLLDTHPADDAPPSPPPRPSPPQPQPRPPLPLLLPPAAARGWPRHDSDSSGVGGGCCFTGGTGTAGAAGAGAAAVSSLPRRFEAESGPSRKCARVGDAPSVLSRSPPALGPMASAGGPTAAVPTRKGVVDGALAPTASSVRTTPVPRVPGSIPGPVRGSTPDPRPQAVAPVAVAASPITLGSMCKRGLLVRATRTFSCLSVVGVRFAKAATWCNNCGLVSCMFFIRYTDCFYVECAIRNNMFLSV